MQLSPNRESCAAGRPDSEHADLLPVGPLVKWAGGKGRLLAELLQGAPASYRSYFEPFLGGAALYFRLRPTSSVLSDSNADLINMYSCVARDPDGVIERLARHRLRHCADYYYAVRELWNTPAALPGSVDRAAAFIYLNRTCYNGLWRVNRRGGFNVPIGRYSDPLILDAPRIRTASRLLSGASLRAAHFAEAVAGAGEGDFVYFDPPYHPISETASFTSYTATNFGPDDHHELAGVARALVERGCAVLVTNSDTPFVRDLYKGFSIRSIACRRSINSNGGARGQQSELLITSPATSRGC